MENPMTKRMLGVAFAAAAALGLAQAPAFGQATETEKKPVAKRPHETVKVPPLREFSPPKASRHVLDNGMVVFLLEDRALPTVDLMAQIRGGAAWEPHEKRGLAGMTGSVWRSGGTEAHPGDALDKLLEGKAASIETGFGREQGSFGLSCLKEDFDALLPILVPILVGLFFFFRSAVSTFCVSITQALLAKGIVALGTRRDTFNANIVPATFAFRQAVFTGLCSACVA